MTNAKRSILWRAFSRLFGRSPEQGAIVDLDRLTRLARRYSVEQQQVPRDLSDLVTLNYLEAIPQAPNGRRFIVDRKTVEVRLE